MNSPLPPTRPIRDYGSIKNTTSTPRSGHQARKKRQANLERLKWWLLVLGTTTAGLFIIAAAVLGIISLGLDPNKLQNRVVTESTKIYDRTGEHVLYEIFNDQKRTNVKLTDIAPLLPKAVIAVEDKYFYEHSGIRIVSILRAGFNNLIGRRTGSGGASTLTQQLIKKTIVGDERRGFAGYFRKIKEALLAKKIEKKYTKDEILALYLNEIPLGSTNYGVESAAQAYFQKSAKDLDLAESATIAGMIQAPSRYLNDLKSLQDRRDLVLRLMYDQKYITQDEEKAAQAIPLNFHAGRGLSVAPHFVQYVKALLADKFGESNIDSQGYKVITTLDYEMQTRAEKIVTDLGNKFSKEYDANNAALVAIDPKNQQILAMVGSRDYNNIEIGGTTNHVIQDPRQPGSSLKPFIYAAAFEKGFTPETVVYDVTTDFNQYAPKNADGKEYGLVTMRKALQGSLNIPAIKALYLVGIKNMLSFAKRFGYTSLGEDAGLSLAIGGNEVVMLEHVNAYATLANGGTYRPPTSILQVTKPSGEKVFEWQDTQKQTAVTPELAATIANVLTDNASRTYIFGANNSMVLPGGRPVAAKTGTTNEDKDAWTIGYTPSLVAGVWVGNSPRRTPMKFGGNKLAGSIWNEFMKQTLDKTPIEKFPTPPSNDAQKAVLRGSDNGIKIPVNIITGKIAASSTPLNLVREETFLPPHDILFYVNKDDPRGPVPDHPESDPQYQGWENALQSWATRMAAAGKAVNFSSPPTEVDTPQSLELVPELEIVSPAASSTLTNRNIVLSVKTSSPRGVVRVTYQIDGFTVNTATNPPFEHTFYAQQLSPGIHTLKVIASDDQGNFAQKDNMFTLDAPFDPPDISWVDASPLSLKLNVFPRVFFLNPFRYEEMKEIQVYLSSQTDPQRKLIFTFNKNDELFNRQLFFTWKNSTGVGTYTLYVVMTDKAGRTVEKTLEVNVE